MARFRVRLRLALIARVVVTVGLPAAGVTAFSAAQAASAASPAAPSLPAWTAYVTNDGSDTVTPVDTATNSAGTAITVGSFPRGVAITPDGRTAYVVNSSFSGTVTPIDTATNTAGTAIRVGGFPEAIAITPDGRTAYVTNAGSDTVTPIDTATNAAGTAIPVGASPQGIAITPDGKTAYVANFGSDSVTPITIATNTAGTAIPVGMEPVGIAITPDAKTAYVTNSGFRTVTPIATATNEPGTAIDVGSSPQAVAITPDGKTAYVANIRSDTVTPIDTASNKPGTAIGVGSAPGGIAITPDGRTAYVADRSSDTVTPIDTATNTAGTVIPPNDTPWAIAITPDQAPVARLSVAAASAGSPTGFDASASTVQFGTIASYAWDFGDGSNVITTSSTVTHTYMSAGTFTASVTETSSGGTSTTRVFTGQTVSRNGGPQASTSAMVVVAPPALHYFPLTPYRILDTRTGLGAPRRPLGSGQSLNLQVTGVQGPTPGQVVPADARAVVMNVTVVEATAPSFLTVWPQGKPQPTASNLNFVAGDIRPNLAQVALGSTGQVSIFNHAGSTQVIADVQGYFALAPSTPAKGLFNPLTPARLLDTRTDTGGHRGPLGPGGSVELQVTGRGGVPATGVEAVILNVTVTDPACPGPLSASCSFLTVWPTGAPRPVVSNLNFSAGETVANRVIVPVGAGGKVSIFNHFGATDVVADVGGWFTDGTNPAATGDAYTPMNPTRILDTRNHTPVGSGRTFNLRVRGVDGIPTDATAAVANFTVTNTSAPSFLTVYPAGEPQPVASDINWVTGQTIANLVATGLGPDGVWSIFNHFGSTDVIADVGGYYQPLP